MRLLRTAALTATAIVLTVALAAVLLLPGPGAKPALSATPVHHVVTQRIPPGTPTEFEQGIYRDVLLDALARAEWDGLVDKLVTEVLAQWQAAAEAEAAVRAALAAAARPSSRAGTPTIRGGSVGDFLACTRAHESDSAGGYRAVSPSGMYRGAYQFSQSTWNATAAQYAGRPDLVGVDPASASPADQDAMAAALYAVAGNGPWEGRC